MGRGGAQREKMGREKGRFAGTIRNHRHICRLQQETEQSRGVVPRDSLLPQPPWIEVEVIPLACTSCLSLLFSDQCLMRQEGSHAQSLGPDTVPVGGRMEEVGF